MTSLPGQANSKVRVLIVDDSSIIRRALQRGLERNPHIEVVGTVPDPYVARDKIVELRPDVITLDIEMPRMDGLTFLRKLMKFHPVPTIVISSLTTEGCDTAFACLEAGAIDVIAKPGPGCSIDDMTDQLAHLILAASNAIVRRPLAVPSSPKPAIAPTTASTDLTPKVIAFGASTGGTEALRAVLVRLPRNVPGIVMAQHMPDGFTNSFAQHLNNLCELDVREAVDGDLILPGVALLAPGNRHMRVTRDGAKLLVRVTDGPSVCRHRPSVEVLFQSTAACVGRDAIGVIMTGMGNDGAHGLKSMRDAGAVTIAQDEASCIVYGMPREAVQCGGAQIIAPLDDIATHIMNFANGTLDAQQAESSARHQC